MRKTIKNVTIVVPVLMTNCHVSLKPKTGPVPAQTTITVTATRKATGRPVARAVHLAKRVNQNLDLVGRIVVLPCLKNESHRSFLTMCQQRLWTDSGAPPHRYEPGPIASSPS